MHVRGRSGGGSSWGPRESPVNVAPLLSVLPAGGRCVHGRLGAVARPDEGGGLRLWASGKQRAQGGRGGWKPTSRSRHSHIMVAPITTMGPLLTLAPSTYSGSTVSRHPCAGSYPDAVWKRRHPSKSCKCSLMRITLSLTILRMICGRHLGSDPASFAPALTEDRSVSRS